MSYLRKSRDLQKERDRYNLRAIDKITNDNSLLQFQDIISDNSNPVYFSLLEYRELIAKTVPRNVRVLELGAGTGENSQQFIDLNCELYLLDISEKSLLVAKSKWGSKANYVNANMEDLPFPDSFFDVVAGAGCLSYGDAETVDAEIFRVLKKNGTVILIDSLNHNLIYRLNRFRHYLLGHRSLSTILRTPNRQRIRVYESSYFRSQLYFFGTYLWVYQLIKSILGRKRALRIFNYLEDLNKLEDYAFKFIFVGWK